MDEAVELTASDGKRHDHYPMYEVVATTDAGQVQVVKRRVFFWDFAGIEGIEFTAAFVALALCGFIACVPLALASAVVVSVSRRNNGA